MDYNYVGLWIYLSWDFTVSCCLIEKVTRHYKFDNSVLFSQSVNFFYILHDLFKYILSYFGTSIK